MRKPLKKLLVCFFLLLPFLLFSQPLPGSGSPGGGTHGLPAGGENSPAPVGNGVATLILLAVGLGYLQYRSGNRNDETPVR